MDPIVRYSDSQVWLDQIFAAKAVEKGGVIRRNRHWVEAEVGREPFLQEARRRGFHVLETGDQLIVVCHGGPIRMIF